MYTLLLDLQLGCGGGGGGGGGTRPQKAVATRGGSGRVTAALAAAELKRRFTPHFKSVCL